MSQTFIVDAIFKISINVACLKVILLALANDSQDWLEYAWIDFHECEIIHLVYSFAAEPDLRALYHSLFRLLACTLTRTTSDQSATDIAILLPMCLAASRSKLIQVSKVDRRVTFCSYPAHQSNRDIKN